MMPCFDGQIVEGSALCGKQRTLCFYGPLMLINFDADSFGYDRFIEVDSGLLD